MRDGWRSDYALPLGHKHISAVASRDPRDPFAGIYTRCGTVGAAFGPFDAFRPYHTFPCLHVHAATCRAVPSVTRIMLYPLLL